MSETIIKNMVHNYSAGPCILPKEVFQKAGQAVLDFNSSGLSILEMSHRSKEIVAVADATVALVKETLGVPSGYSVLFLQGGASLQFYMAALNLLKKGGKAGYIDTGAWSSKAVKEAKRLGDIQVLASSKDKNYNYIPKGFDIPSDLDFVHYTTNNTIYGTEFFDIPHTDAPLVADMSSDIFSRSVNVADFGLISAGAQKNLGPSGTVLVIIRKSLLNQCSDALPLLLNYNAIASKNSMLNTPPTFGIYLMGQVFKWIQLEGGLKAMEDRNIHKAKLIY
ncbi:MAG: 3-phosphoserine/phosphohydroxythreonine transaminase, partial [Flavobacteriales bacterium]|nr:3-phosphoserine/phosphohydroxythreonine transaminase [Flavobacteriales bacterium]